MGEDGEVPARAELEASMLCVAFLLFCGGYEVIFVDMLLAVGAVKN